MVTAHSSIFGPEEITVLEGSPVSIKCFYPNSSVNRHSRKFWCQPDKTGRCMTLISTDFISAAYKGKAKLTDFPEENSFVVEINKVNQDDTGSYKCGVGVNDRGLDFTVSLHVNKGKQPALRASRGKLGSEQRKSFQIGKGILAQGQKIPLLQGKSFSLKKNFFKQRLIYAFER